uniref:Circadian clock-controlled protein n=2 Tax=Bactrocera latifrons TaxID=174628 RepID=A0A0K8UZQ7_BACLA
MLMKHTWLALSLALLFWLDLSEALIGDEDVVPQGTEEESFNTDIDLSGDAKDDHNVRVTENRLAAQLFAVLEHFKQEDPVGFPGAPIPDPMEVPDMRKGLGMGTLSMMQVKAYGLSKFRIDTVQADLKAMKVEAGIQLDKMDVRGKYTLSSLFTRANGPFTVVLKNVYVKANAALAVQRDGHLTTERIKMDITFGDMSMDFQNLGLVGNLFQSVVNSAPTLVFDAMKPFMLAEADMKLREEINGNLEKFVGDRLLPNSISPLDMAIAEGRKKVRDMGYDPYHLPDYNRTAGIFTFQLVNSWIWGVSSFYRVGDMSVAMQNNTIKLHFHVGTQEIAGESHWEIDFTLGSRTGVFKFSVQYIRVTVELSQSLDTRKRPQINDLQIDLGNIQIRSDGAGTLDYIAEAAVNILPNLLRYQIMDILENPVKMRIQEKFDSIDVEKAIKENFEKFQTMGDDFSFDFKL